MLILNSITNKESDVYMKRLFTYGKRYWLHLVVATLSSVGASVSTVVVIDILRQLIDSIAQQRLLSGLTLTVIKMLVTIVVGMLFNYLVIATTGYIGANLLKDLRNDSLKSIMKASPEFMNTNNFGDLIERMSEDIESLAGFMSGYFKDCLYVPIITLVYCVYLIRMQPTLAIICLLPLLILVPINIKLIKPIKLRQFQYVKELGMTNNNIQETFDGVEIIKAYNLQKKLEDKYYKALKKTFDTSNDIDLRQYNIEPLSRAIQEVPLAITLCLGGSLVLSGNITMGVLIALISTIKKLIDPLSNAYQLIVRSQTAMVGVSRVFDVINTPAEIYTTENLLTNNAPENVLTFNNVSFSYNPKEDTKTINTISFSIKKGTKVAFVGKSGSGKSTLLKLISRQLEIDEGSIDYYGVMYSDSAPDQIRRHLALIAQDTDIFSMTIADNVRIGNPKATPEQIMEALRLAGCDDFIRDMPDGMNSILTEKGSNLSGGQRQRIAIARAILKGAPVILLDEPTAALDKTTESYICQTINALAKDKTVITVAHRLHTIKDYDVIYVVDDGHIVEQGNHNELMNRQTIYYEMYQEYEK